MTVSTAQASAPLASSSLQTMANAIRALSMDAVQKANSGHPGMPMGMADVATVLFTKFLKFNPKDPQWADRDRFILSAGHGSMLLYSLLHLTGYEEITLDQIKNFRQLHSKTCGHPEFGEAGGIETTTGPLGQGISNAVGFALAERLLNARYGDALVNHYTYTIAGDGCLMEGISHEAISLAGHLGLSKLIVLFDDNDISIDGPTSLSVSDDQLKRFESSGWFVQKVDGHDMAAVEKAIATAKAQSAKPSMIACKTVIGKFAPKKAGTSGSHGSPLGAEEIEGARKAMGWDAAPFEIPSDVLNAWRTAGARSEGEYAAWNQRLNADAKKAAFVRTNKGELPANFAEVFAAHKADILAKKPKEATRQSSGNTLAAIVEAIPELIGGSADLTGSNLTKTATLAPVTAKDFSGRYVYYGVREHGMAAAMNGMALHGGIIPYGGTFFVFTDYCRPSIRLSALMKQRVIYVMTHDSIGLGEDGPTHQPVEHLAAMRAMPNVLNFRPCDALETAECWELALLQKETPSLLVLTRQGLPLLRNDAAENKSAKGGYILQDAPNAKVTIIGTGSEVMLAVDAAKKLGEQGIAARVVSMPCTELFDVQTSEYKKSVLGENTLKVAVEAGSSYGWERYIGLDGIFIGMPGFGASAPAEKLYEHFGITVENIVNSVKKRSI